MRQTYFSQSRNCVAWVRDLYSDSDKSCCYRDFVQSVRRPPRFRPTCLITSVVYCHYLLRFIVNECVRLSLFQINTTAVTEQPDLSNVKNTATVR